MSDYIRSFLIALSLIFLGPPSSAKGQESQALRQAPASGPEFAPINRSQGAEDFRSQKLVGFSYSKGLFVNEEGAISVCKFPLNIGMEKVGVFGDALGHHLSLDSHRISLSGFSPHETDKNPAAWALLLDGTLPRQSGCAQAHWQNENELEIQMRFFRTEGILILPLVGVWTQLSYKIKFNSRDLVELSIQYHEQTQAFWVPSFENAQFKSQLEREPLP